MPDLTPDTTMQADAVIVPLSRLKRSPKNVRRAYAPAGIEALAANIAAEGLLQAPVVEPELDEAGQPTGCYLVDAGERRRRALLLLAKQKRLRRSAGIRCTLRREDANGRSVSLSENALREAMLGHVSGVSFDGGGGTLPCLLRAARSAYPRSWRRAAWNKHLRAGEWAEAPESCASTCVSCRRRRRGWRAAARRRFNHGAEPVLLSAFASADRRPAVL